MNINKLDKALFSNSYALDEGKEEECIRFEGKALYVNKAALDKYGISLCIEEE